MLVEDHKPVQSYKKSCYSYRKVRSLMVELKDVHGSKEASAELIIGYDTVYVHSNVRKVTEAGPDGTVPEDLYVYDEIQYEKDEYIKMMADKSSKLESDTAQNRSDIDYLMLVTDNSDVLNEEEEA